MKLPGISWYGLQMDGAQNKAPTGLTLPVVDCSGGLRDYADMAALAANLDLVIAVDSPQAHLAAAIGRPVWTLLPFESDWRWLHRREDTPWYPTMRLFRQSQPGDWDGVIRRWQTPLAPSPDRSGNSSLCRGNRANSLQTRLSHIRVEQVMR